MDVGHLQSAFAWHDVHDQMPHFNHLSMLECNIINLPLSISVLQAVLMDDAIFFTPWVYNLLLQAINPLHGLSSVLHRFTIDLEVQLLYVIHDSVWLADKGLIGEHALDESLESLELKACIQAVDEFNVVFGLLSIKVPILAAHILPIPLIDKL